MGLHRPLVAGSKAVYSQWDELDLELMKFVGREETIRPRKSSPNFVEASSLWQVYRGSQRMD
jgi:hypothetical protein